MENTTEIVVKKVEQNPDVKALGTRIENYTTYASTLEIKTEEQEKQAAETLLLIKDDSKKADSIRKFFVDPYNAYVKAINARFDRILDPLAAAKNAINAKLVAWQDAKAKKAAVAQTRVMKQVETGKIDPEKAVDKLANIKEPEKTVKAETASVTYRTDYKAVVVDANAVPREYCSPDPAKFKDAAIALHKGGQTQIPGIQVEKIKTPVSRRNY